MNKLLDWIVKLEFPFYCDISKVSWKRFGNSVIPAIWKVKTIDDKGNEVIQDWDLGEPEVLKEFRTKSEHKRIYGAFTGKEWIIHHD